MDRTAVEQWVADYERLWRTPGTERLAELFVPDASYLPSPWAPPVEGLEAIARFWEAERDGADEEFEMSSDLVAVDGGIAVVRVFVTYAALGNRPWRDLWVLRFAEDGRCSWFEEWPFAPGQPMGTSRSPLEWVRTADPARHLPCQTNSRWDYDPGHGRRHLQR